MKTIFLLSDSVNRRYLSAYGNHQIQTPHLARLQDKSCVFTNHWTGSAPCMPARRDILTGRLGFLERNWGPIEAFDAPLTDLLREHSVRSHMVTDHYHYLEYGGEGYLQSFDTYQCYRGQEHDNLEWLPAASNIPEHKGLMTPFYVNNRAAFSEESEFTSPKTYQAAADWLKRHGNEGHFVLWVEGFDPHEPFETPKEYLDMYNDEYDGEFFIWPEYAPFTGSKEELTHIRNRYAATLSMTDVWIGKILDVCDELELWDDTQIIFTTDHGYMLGEHGFMAKNYMPAYNEVFHIPLMIHNPGQQHEKRIAGLSQNIDLFPTIAAHHGIDESEFTNPVHGKDLTPLMNGEKESLRDCVLYGIFGKSVNIFDGRYTYFRAPIREDNTPLDLYTSMPTTLKQSLGGKWLRDAFSIDMGRYLSWTNYPVYRFSAESFLYDNRNMRFDLRSEYHACNYLFDLENDYQQERNLSNTQEEARILLLLKEAMMTHDSPAEQFERLGLKRSFRFRIVKQ